MGWLCRTGLGQARLGWVGLISWFSWLAVLLQHFSIANGCTRRVGQPIRLRRVTTTQRRRSDPIPDAACRRATRADPIRFHDATQPIRSDSPRQHMSPIRSDVDSHDDTIAHDQTPHQQGHGCPGQRPKRDAHSALRFTSIHAPRREQLPLRFPCLRCVFPCSCVARAGHGSRDNAAQDEV